MNLLCAMGRHRWVTRQGTGELGEVVTFRQCERCRHYPKTSSWLQRDPDRWEPFHPGDTSGAGGGGSVGV